LAQALLAEGAHGRDSRPGMEHNAKAAQQAAVAEVIDSATETIGSACGTNVRGGGASRENGTGLQEKPESPLARSAAVAQNYSAEEAFTIEDFHGDRAWHYRYNRSLACFAKAVSCITFSHDGRWLITGTGSGDMKAWDVSRWSDAGALKGSRREEPDTVVISPAQRWLVSVQPSALHVFHCKPPWALEHVFQQTVCPGNQEASEWCCAAFSPTVEVDNMNGIAGQDNHMAAMSTTHLCVLDYSGGWSSETPQRTHSILRFARPTGICFTPCRAWLACTYVDGQLQLWNAFSLTIERKISAHTGMVTCLTFSPQWARYDPRLVTCGLDRSIRVWHCCGWIQEHMVSDTRCDDNGVSRCTFSSNGRWLLSVAKELCVWRVCVSRKDRVHLRLHQRLEGVCSIDGLRAAAFCCLNDAIVVGARDGVLGVWARHPGFPPEPMEDDVPQSPGSGRPIVAAVWEPERLPRPMRRVSCLEGLESKSPIRRSLIQSGPEGWMFRMNTRCLPLPAMRAGCGGAGGGALTTVGGGGGIAYRANKGKPMDFSLAGNKSNSVPDIGRWSSRNFGFDAVLNPCPPVSGPPPHDGGRVPAAGANSQNHTTKHVLDAPAMAL